MNIGIKELLDAIVERIPPPKGDINLPTKALIIDSWYDLYRGVVALVRVFDGKLAINDEIILMSSRAIIQLKLSEYSTLCQVTSKSYVPVKSVS